MNERTGLRERATAAVQPDRGPWRDVSDHEWNDWRWQARNLIRSIDTLERVLPLSGIERTRLIPVMEEFHFSITPYYASLIDTEDPRDPIRLQAVPSTEETRAGGVDREDPLAEEENSPVPGLTHRYPDRVLLVTTNYCYMYCRHCTRKRIWRETEAPLTDAALDRMIDYMRVRPEIRDALVSGGDPLTLPLARLDRLLGRLREIPHLEIIRIGSRVPVVMPMRIDRDLLSVLERHSPVWLNTQFNHPREVTPEAARAVDRLLRAGVPVNNQSVLLRGINDRPETMLSLNQALLRAKVRPYYLFQCDPVVGTGHFRTPITAGLRVMEALRGYTSGLAVPTYVVDLPGGGGKVPVSPNYLVGESEEGVVFRNYEGKTFVYPADPARGATRPVTV